MFADLRYLVGTMALADRTRLLLSCAAQFGLATLDLLGVAAILPLMEVVRGAPLTSGTLGTVHRMLGSQSKDVFVLTLAVIMGLAFLLKTIFALAATWWTGKLVARLQSATSRRLLTSYLSEDALEHRMRSTGELMRTVGTAAADAHTKVLGGILSVISSLMSMTLIVALLLMVSPGPTLVAALYIGAVVFIIQRILGPANRRAGTEAQLTSWVTSHALIDAMQGYREAVLHNARAHFIDRFDDANKRMALASVRANQYANAPKYLLELFTMMGLTAYLAGTVLTGDAAQAIPTLSLFVAATVKLLPVMVALTTTIGSVRLGREGLGITVAALKEADARPARALVDLPPEHQSTHKPADIALREVCFRYPDGSKNVLEKITVSVPAGSSFAICGVSGSGKTTLVDVILGLFPPTSGEVTYAGIPTTQAGAEWHNVVAYVPQDVYISDDTLAGNVAFGLNEDAFDVPRIRECLEKAALADLIASLPDGLNTRLGERGSRVSGGQRQRIGIARALYRGPRVIVLDEATSALDNETEDQVTQTLAAVRGQITTIIVAHRLSTVRHVDKLAFLKNGQLDAVGTFKQVQENSSEFDRLVQLGKIDD